MKFNNHKYEYSRQFGNPTHSWSLIGPSGGVQFHVRTYDKHTICGLEYHASSRAAHKCVGKAPSHLDCWLLKETCWHDGGSTYATDTLWPIAKHYLELGDHETVWRMLERQYNEYFMEFDEEEEGQ